MDMLNLTANERLDLADLSYAVFDSQIGLHRAITGQVLMDANGAAPAYILSGFAVTNPGGAQVTVTRGVALLPYRTDTGVLYGMVASEGPTTQTLDLSTRAAGTYTVYITFTYQPGADDTRTLWASDNGGSEYAAAVPTRQVAGWQLVVETASPGSEWLPIATVTTPSMAIVDMRPFYFEGRADQAFAPQWGSTADRADARANTPITNLQTFVQAVQQCLIDIKGPGIAKWYTPYIAGQTIGFAGTAKTSATAWGDADFNVFGSAAQPGVNFSSDAASLSYNRAAGNFVLVGGSRAASTVLGLSAPGAQPSAVSAYQLLADANAVSLRDSANNISPVTYTPAAKNLDISAGGQGTLKLPLPTKTTYASAQVATTYMPFTAGAAIIGAATYPTTPVAVGANTLFLPNGQVTLTASGSNSPYLEWVLPLRVPNACTLTGITINYLPAGTAGNIYIAVMRHLNATGTTTISYQGTTVTSSVMTPAVAIATDTLNGTQAVHLNPSVANTTALNEQVATTDQNSYYLVASASAPGAAITVDYIMLSYTLTAPPFAQRC